MKKINIRFATFFLIVFSISCNTDEFLELKSPNNQSWITPKEFEEAAATSYNIALWGGYDNFAFFDISVFTSYSPVARWVEGHTEQWMQEELQNRDFSYEINEVADNFSKPYQVIGNCNAAIDFYISNGEAPGYPFQNMTDEEKRFVDMIAGECYALRAYAYLSLVSRHCPPFVKGQPNDSRHLILSTRLATSPSQATNVCPSPTYEIWNQMVEDLKKAKELLQPTAPGPGRITVYAASALLSRIYFRMGLWEEAEAECSFVINGPFDLNEDPVTAFSYSDYTQKGTEVIWQCTFDEKRRSTDGAVRLLHITKNHRDADV
ncbi:MAG: hypothetical protein HC906_02375 [Bacteroidales bacterium]|nr:hypothetical protein [Bacteroidales bacterium]